VNHKHLVSKNLLETNRSRRESHFGLVLAMMNMRGRPGVETSGENT
jgi:hypothetical protein